MRLAHEIEASRWAVGKCDLRGGGSHSRTEGSGGSSYVDLSVKSDSGRPVPAVESHRFSHGGPALEHEALEPIRVRLGRSINPTVYTRRELAKRIKEGNAFVKRVLAQPKIWLIGSENELGA